MTGRNDSSGAGGPPTSTVESRQSWTIAFSALAILSLANALPYVAAVALKPIATELATPRWVPALANALIYLGTGLGGIVMGWWADKVGVRWTVMVGGAMMGAGALLASGGAVWQLFVGEGLLMGLLGYAGINAPVAVYVSRWFDRRRGTALALISSGQFIAGTITPPLANAAIEQFGWRATFFVAGLIVLSLLVPLGLLLRRPPPAASRPGQPAPGPVVGAPVLGLRAGQAQALLCAAGLFCCIAMAMPVAHLVAFCGDLGFGAARGAEMLSLVLATAFLSRQFWGWVADRLGGLTAILLGSACQLVGITLYAAVGDLGGLYLVSAAFGFGFSGLVPSYLTTIRELFPAREAGWRMPTLQLFTLLGMASGTWLAGYIFDLTADYHLAFATGALFNLANFVIIGTLVLRRSWQRRQSAVALARP